MDLVPLGEELIHMVHMNLKTLQCRVSRHVRETLVDVSPPRSISLVRHQRPSGAA